jgi:hypothetical protein
MLGENINHPASRTPTFWLTNLNKFQIKEMHEVSGNVFFSVD